MLNTIGFLGCGNMGGAIARAVCKASDPQNVWLANRTAAKAEALAAELGCNTDHQTRGGRPLRPHLLSRQTPDDGGAAGTAPLHAGRRPSRFVLCSMAAGLSIARSSGDGGGDCPVIRIMPNTPASVGPV